MFTVVYKWGFKLKLHIKYIVFCCLFVGLYVLTATKIRYSNEMFSFVTCLLLLFIKIKLAHILTDKPKNVSVSISPGEIVEGSSVTLTCSSDANPPVHNYTWYMRTGAESLIRGTGDSISFNVTSDSSGLYYCEAENEVGSQTSTGVAVPTEGQCCIVL